MLQKIISGFHLALNNIRANFFRTVLSILGIVIGVASLVAILSLIDGLEQYAREQITLTTSLKAIMIKTESMKVINGVRVPKDSVSILDYNSIGQLSGTIHYPATFDLYTRHAGEVTLVNEVEIKSAAMITASSNLKRAPELLEGVKFTQADVERGSPVALVNEAFAREILAGGDLEKIVGKKIVLYGNLVEIIGVFANRLSKTSEIFCPISLLPVPDLRKNPPTCIIEAENIEDVADLKHEVNGWLQQRYKDPSDFVVLSNDMRVAQATKGFGLFRVVMGLIVGISVLVGGIGVMNVLLISVTERTVEIGIRKAVGANKRDIVWQFLSESVTISTFGSFLGLVVGILSTMVMAPVIHAVTGISFPIAYTLDTFLTVAILAIVTGIVFGTYPAIRAARLDPVEAIRRE